MPNYTHLIESEYLDIWQCNDCGAYAELKKNIVHYQTCNPGESKRWETEDKEN
jgi:protocatechuate 3,4-dioxygenase beta subunit